MACFSLLAQSKDTDAPSLLSLLEAIAITENVGFGQQLAVIWARAAAPTVRPIDVHLFDYTNLEPCKGLKR